MKRSAKLSAETFLRQDTTVVGIRNFETVDDVNMTMTRHHLKQLSRLRYMSLSLAEISDMHSLEMYQISLMQL